MTVRVMVGHVLDRLQELPAESVHCVVTSPPYYGLRDYGIEPQVWGGDPAGCEHEWDAHKRVWDNRHAQAVALGLESKGCIGSKANATSFERSVITGFCRRCGAWRGSLGLEPTPALYVEHMVAVFREIKRVLRKDGTLWLNMGDAYCSAQGGRQAAIGELPKDGAARFAKGKPKVRNDVDVGGWSTRNVGNRVIPAAGQGCKPKDLLGMPWMLAFALRDDGWWLRSCIRWCKRAPMPESCSDRPTSAVEEIFLLTKSGSPTYWTHRDHAGSRTKPPPDYRWVDHDNDDAETDVEPPNWRTESIAKILRFGGRDQTYPAAVGGTHRDHSGGKDGGLHTTPTQHRKRWSRINLWDAHDYSYDAEAVKEEAERAGEIAGGCYATKPGDGKFIVANRYAAGEVPAKRNLRNFWLLGPEPFPEAHFATFPTEIPRRAILAGTSERGVCPKCGAGWERVTRKTRVQGKRWRDRNADLERGQRGGASGFHGEERKAYEDQSTETIGWRPTCSCAAGAAVPATCLDPFFGAGTTGLVADRLGRHCIGIELNESYARMAENRIRSDAGMFAFILRIA